MPHKSVFALHDDGRWWPAELLDQYRRRDGSRRVVVRFTTEPGSTYLLALPGRPCRPLAKA
jgi:hypothetical protein